MRKWKKYPGRKNSIMINVCPDHDNESYYWTWNKKWLSEFLKMKVITNIEYLDGLKALEEVKNAQT